MKKNNIIYWVSTAIVSLLMLFSAFNYITNEQIKGAFVHLGFPSYFRIELAVAKVAGVVALLAPFVPDTLKQLAYFGFAITFISAFIAHTASGDPAGVATFPLIVLGLLAVSYIFFLKKNALKTTGY